MKIIEGTYLSVEGEIQSFSSYELEAAYEKIDREFNNRAKQDRMLVEEAFPGESDFDQIFTLHPDSKEKTEMKKMLKAKMKDDRFHQGFVNEDVNDTYVIETPSGRVEMRTIREILDFSVTDGATIGKNRMKITLF